MALFVWLGHRLPLALVAACSAHFGRLISTGHISNQAPYKQGAFFFRPSAEIQDGLIFQVLQHQTNNPTLTKQRTRDSKSK
jgi:hypothetical protein